MAKLSVNDDRGRTLPWRWRHLVSAAQAPAISYGKNRRRVVTDNTVFHEPGARVAGGLPVIQPGSAQLLRGLKGGPRNAALANDSEKGADRHLGMIGHGHCHSGSRAAGV